MDLDDEVTPSVLEGGAGLGGGLAPDALPLESLDEDTTFRLREEGELSGLATDLARLGQLFPIDVRPAADGRYQVICGFRRVAALKFLQRERVQARVHEQLSDEDALLMSLAATLHTLPLEREALEGLKDGLEQAGRLFPAAQDMLDRALLTEDPLAPEMVNEDGTPAAPEEAQAEEAPPASDDAAAAEEAEDEDTQSGDEDEEEVDADELADDVTLRLGEINQDLALLADVFASLEESKRQELLTQLKYSSELVAFLEEK